MMRVDYNGTAQPLSVAEAGLNASLARYHYNSNGNRLLIQESRD